jgi:prepilin-type N-terminal cleavage/methylation domain-containing protein
MRTVSSRVPVRQKSSLGFTLTEVVISLAIAGLVFSGVIYGYVLTTDQAEWSCYSLAAHSLAMQGVEQARAAKWDPQAWPGVDELGVTNFDQVSTMDVPVIAGGNPTLATNYISISTVSIYPPLRELRTDCVWNLPYRKGRTGGPFTNTVVTLRAADQ